MKSDSEKKKLLAFGALAVVLACVGLWQVITMMGGPRPAAQAPGKAPAKAPGTNQLGIEGTKRPDGSMDVTYRGGTNANLRPGMGQEGLAKAAEDAYLRETQPHLYRDGAPQPGKPAGPDATMGAAAPGASTGPAPSGRVPRDPFAGGARPSPSKPPPIATAMPAPPRVSPMRPPLATPVEPLRPLGGTLPDALPTPSAPPNPVFSSNPGGETLPNATPDGLRVTPGKPLRQPGELPVTLVGVVVGPHSVAVFETDGGDQKSFKVGSEVVPGSRIIRIERRKVVVRHLGKQVALTLGGNP